MSYTIVYKSQFIKSKLGITPVLLAGCNNVTEPTYSHGRHYERRERSWCCYGSMLGLPADELVKQIADSVKDSEYEIWKKDGKFVYADGVVRWAKNGCRTAATIEDILFDNFGIFSIDCKVGYYEKPDDPSGYSTYKETERCYVKTTEEFDEWIGRARAAMATLKANPKVSSVYPTIDFGIQDVYKNPLPETITEDSWIKGKYGWVAKVEGNNRVLWTKGNDFGSRMIVTPKLYEELRSDELLRRHLSGCHMVKASEPKDAYVIRITAGAYTGKYVEKHTARRLYFTSGKGCAWSYNGKAAAERCIESIKTKFKAVVDAEVVPLNEGE